MPEAHAREEQSASSDGSKTVPEPMAGYAPPEERPPLVSYGALALLFNLFFGGALFLIRRSGRELPERVEERDLVLIGVASHKLSRLIAKDKVTSAFRSPFTEFQESGGPAEFEERPRGRGMRRAIAELLVCPWCVGLWVVAAFSLGLVVAPRLTRFLAGVFAALGISDFLQIAYKAAENKGL
jgi:Protein of unknown function (DUF1360)